jgi:hypothetical protein
LSRIGFEGIDLNWPMRRHSRSRAHGPRSRAVNLKFSRWWWPVVNACIRSSLHSCMVPVIHSYLTARKRTGVIFSFPRYHVTLHTHRVAI